MVSGIVKAPSLELANRDLIESHLHAVWLAESRQELMPDIPHVLNLELEGLPLVQELGNAIKAPALTSAHKQACSGYSRVWLTNSSR